MLVRCLRITLYIFFGRQERRRVSAQLLCNLPKDLNTQRRTLGIQAPVHAYFICSPEYDAMCDLKLKCF